MDNDNKVNGLEENQENLGSQKNQETQTHREVQLFLKDELKKLRFAKAEQYNLEEEYAKTKKNKDKSVGIILAVCSIIVCLLVVALTTFITSQNHKIAVNIDTFNDLNLRALLNSAGRTESLYANALQSKEILLAKMEDELASAKRKMENDLYVLKSVEKVSSRNSILARQRKIQEEYEKNQNSIHEKYDPQIKAAEGKITALQEKLSGYDTEKLSAAQADEAVLDSQKQLNDIQMEMLEKKYQTRIEDLKANMVLQQQEAARQQREAVESVRKTYQAKIDLLDPDARSQSAEQNQIILETGIPQNAVLPEAMNFKASFEPETYLSQFKAPEEVFTSSIKKAAGYLSDLNTVADRFATIPQERSISHYVPAIQRLAFSITTEMADSQRQMQVKIDSLNSEISEKNAVISEFENSFEELCLSDPSAPADACITGAKDKNRLILYVAKASRNKFPLESSVLDAQIRDGKRILCDLTVTRTASGYTAAIKNTARTPNPGALTVGAKIYFVIPQTQLPK